MQIDPAALREQLQAINTDAETLLRGLNEAQFNWRPAPRFWSIAQCLAHLNRFGQQFLPTIAEGLAQAAVHNGAPAASYKLSWLERRFCLLLEPPVRARFKAPARFMPVPDQRLAEVRQEFQAVQDHLAALLQQAERLPWETIKVASPRSALLKLRLPAMLLVVLAHERRHLWQAWQLRKQPAFPAD